MCQRTKPHRTPAKTLLHPFSPPSRPWESITIDIIGPLPESQGFNAILVIVDQFSKVIKLEAITMELTSEGTARILRDQVFRDHRLPRRIVHNRDTRFTSSYTLSLMTLLGVQQNPSTAYHPQTDGQTEQVNQDVEQYLRIFINYQQDNWKDWLSIAEFSHNNSIHSAISTTPFLVNTGQHPWTGQDTRKDVRNEAAMSFHDRMKRSREDAHAALQQAADRMKKSYDKHVCPNREYSKGDKVYLETTNLKTDRPAKKLDDKRFGPFDIIEKVGASAYKLKLPDTWPAIHPTFHNSYLTPFQPSQFEQQQRPAPPPAIIVNDEEEYEVEEILNSQKRRNQIQYLVRWKGYEREDDTWEPPSNLKNANQAIADFHAKYPKKPAPKSTTIRNLCVEELDPQLYDPAMNMQGEGFVYPLDTTPCGDVIVPLDNDDINNLFTYRIIPSLPTLPPSVKCVWIYDMCKEAINLVV